MSRKSERPKGPRRRSPWSYAHSQGGKARSTNSCEDAPLLPPLARPLYPWPPWPFPFTCTIIRVILGCLLLSARTRASCPTRSRPAGARACCGRSAAPALVRVAGLAPEDAGCPGRRGLALPPPPPCAFACRLRSKRSAEAYSKAKAPDPHAQHPALHLSIGFATHHPTTSLGCTLFTRAQVYPSPPCFRFQVTGYSDV